MGREGWLHARMEGEREGGAGQQLHGGHRTRNETCRQIGRERGRGTADRQVDSPAP